VYRNEASMPTDATRDRRDAAVHDVVAPRKA
jgi:hypothetical protein